MTFYELSVGPQRVETVQDTLCNQMCQSLSAQQVSCKLQLPTPLDRARTLQDFKKL